MPLVYRIEMPNGVGMYRCYLACADDIQDDMRHPTPTEDAELWPFWKDMGYRERGQMRFGYATIAQLKSWVYKKSWRKKIKDHGLVVSVYRARFVRVGSAQAVFRLRTAKKIGEIDILDLDAPMKVCKKWVRPNSAPEIEMPF